jgi:hypothetical protein
MESFHQAPSTNRQSSRKQSVKKYTDRSGKDLRRSRRLLACFSQQAKQGRKKKGK